MIVLVEDSPVQAERLRVVLSEAGFTVRVARNGEHGLSLCREELPMLVVTDVVMPGMDGLELTRRIRTEARLASVPVIVMTASSEPADVVRALEAGADNFVAKPYDDATLLARVQRTLRASRTERRGAAGELFLSALEDAAAARRKADDASRAKDEFLAMLSHELRTPLNAITGWAAMLRAGTLDEKTKARAVEVIERNAKIQTRLIEDMLDVSRIASGELRLEASALSLAEVVEAAIDAVRPDAERRGVEISFERPARSLMVGDGGRLQQVAWNLMTNAVKFSEPGGTIHVSLAARQHDLVLSVRDQGRGIGADQLPLVFERFQQAHQRRQGESGLGLGLAIAKHIVERHGGTIEVASEGPGRGATFTVTLPGTTDSQEQATGPTESLDGLSVLLVDDESDARELTAVVLAEAGALVEAVPTAQEALEKVAGKDVLVSDITMPHMDGYALLRAVRARTSTSGGRIRAVALTAVGGAAARDRAMAAGFDVFVTKPTTPRDLVRVVAMVAAPQRGRS